MECRHASAQTKIGMIRAEIMKHNKHQISIIYHVYISETRAITEWPKHDMMPAYLKNKK